MRLVGAKRMLKSFLPWFVCSLLIAAFSFKLLLSTHRLTYLPWIIALFLLLYIWQLKLDAKADHIEATWIKGARGERRVAEALKGIESEDFHVIHDLPNGHGNIDHVVVGRTGLFVIETKAHDGRVHYTTKCLCLNGHPFDKDPLKQVRRQAAYLADKLKPMTRERIFVNPVLCFTNAWVDNNALTVEHVRVTRPRFLSKIVTEGKAKFSRDEVEKMALALRPEA